MPVEHRDSVGKSDRLCTSAKSGRYSPYDPNEPSKYLLVLVPVFYQVSEFVIWQSLVSCFPSKCWDPRHDRVGQKHRFALRSLGTNVQHPDIFIRTGLPATTPGPSMRSWLGQCRAKPIPLARPDQSRSEDFKLLDRPCFHHTALLTLYRELSSNVRTHIQGTEGNTASNCLKWWVRF